MHHCFDKKQPTDSFLSLLEIYVLKKNTQVSKLETVSLLILDELKWKSWQCLLPSCLPPRTRLPSLAGMGREKRPKNISLCLSLSVSFSVSLSLIALQPDLIGSSETRIVPCSLLAQTQGSWTVVPPHRLVFSCGPPRVGWRILLDVPIKVASTGWGAFHPSVAIL